VNGALKSFLRLGILIVVLAVPLLFIEDRGSPEFVASVLSVCIGATLIALVVLVARWSS
jgi:hypothetical protein